MMLGEFSKRIDLSLCTWQHVLMSKRTRSGITRAVDRTKVERQELAERIGQELPRDGLDGFLARRFNQRSRLGAVLDPIADKGLVMTAIVVLTLSNRSKGFPIWF